MLAAPFFVTRIGVSRYQVEPRIYEPTGDHLAGDSRLPDGELLGGIGIA